MSSPKILPMARIIVSVYFFDGSEMLIPESDRVQEAWRFRKRHM